MSKSIIITLGSGNLDNGFPSVNVELKDENNQSLVKYPPIYLPPAPQVKQLFERWQYLYYSYYGRSKKKRTSKPANFNDTPATTRESSYSETVTRGLEIPDSGITNYLHLSFEGVKEELKKEINNWLNNESFLNQNNNKNPKLKKDQPQSFRKITEKITRKLVDNETINVIICTKNKTLQLLPWHLWEFFDTYKKAEPAVWGDSSERIPPVIKNKSKVRILAILGGDIDSKGNKDINPEEDLKILEKREDAEIKILAKPSRYELYKYIYDDKGWDILCFSGHSRSENDEGILSINNTDILTLKELKYALEKAIEKGLYIAIFNSCDGLGLAQDLADLHIPEIIIMREEVPDLVAQNFLKYFVELYAKREELYSAVREARQKLHGLENDYISASWLPLIFQNPTVTPLIWHDLLRIICSTNREQLGRKLRQNLPKQDHKFIGRVEELKKLLTYLSENYGTSTISIDGIAGVGKTALIVEAAYLCLAYRECGDVIYQDPNFPQEITEIPAFDLIIFTSAKEEYLTPTAINQGLAIQRTIQEIYHTIADMLEEPTLRFHAGQEAIIAIRNKLRQQITEKGRVLLIIDNLETILEQKKIIAFIQELPPGVKIVITTRETQYWSSLSLKSLSKVDSIKLIEQQLKEKEITLTHSEKNQLYQATDGIPLAIIYSIGRLKNKITFATVIENLQDYQGDLACFCFKKSVDDIRTNHPLAHQLLMCIAIFHTSPRQDAVFFISGITNNEQNYQDLALLDRISLINLSGDKKCRILALTRSYVLSELALPENSEFEKRVRERWINWYLEFAKKEYINWHERRINYHRLKEEWSNLTAVLRWCKDHDLYENVRDIWSYLNNYANLRGHWSDRINWLNWLMRESIRVSDYSTTMRTKSKLGRTFLLRNDEKSLKYAEQLLLEAWKIRNYGTFQNRDYLTNHLAGLYLRLENYPEAHKWLNIEQELLDHEPNLTNNERIKYQLYINREKAELLLEEGKYLEAKEYCQKGIPLAQTINTKRLQHYLERILANILILEHNFDEAERLLQEGFDQVKSSQDKRRIAYYEDCFARLEYAKGVDLTKAIEYAKKAETHFSGLRMARDTQRVQKLLDEIQTKLNQIKLQNNV